MLRGRLLRRRPGLPDRLTLEALRQRLRRLPDASRRITGLTATGGAALVIAVVLWVIGRIVGGRPLYLLAYGTVMMVALAWLLAQRQLPLTGSRADAAHRAQEGDDLVVGVTLQAKRNLSTVIVEERVPERLGQTVKLALEEIPRGDTERRYALQFWRRGAFTVGPLVARFGDPIGLVSREQVIAEPFDVLVHPTLEAVSDRPLTRQFEDPPLRPKNSKPWPTGMEFYGMRDIRPGDDLRRVVWRALARSGRLMVREAEQGITDRVTLLLNTASDSYPGGEEFSPGFEAAVRVTASLGVRHLGEGYAVTLEANAGRLTPLPVRGPHGRIALLDALARVERGREPLSAAILRLVQQKQRDHHNVLITPRLDRPEAAQLRLVLRTGVSVLVVVVRYGDRYEEAAHNAAALGCQVIEASPHGGMGGELLSELGVQKSPAHA